MWTKHQGGIGYSHPWPMAKLIIWYNIAHDWLSEGDGRRRCTPRFARRTGSCQNLSLSLSLSLSALLRLLKVLTTSTLVRSSEPDMSWTAHRARRSGLLDVYPFLSVQSGKRRPAFGRELLSGWFRTADCCHALLVPGGAWIMPSRHRNRISQRMTGETCFRRCHGFCNWYCQLAVEQWKLPCSWSSRFRSIFMLIWVPMYPGDAKVLIHCTPMFQRTAEWIELTYGFRGMGTKQVSFNWESLVLCGPGTKHVSQQATSQPLRTSGTQHVAHSLAASHNKLHPVSLRRFPSFRTQPLENLTPPSMNKWVPEQPSHWRTSSKRESCYGDRVYYIVLIIVIIIVW